MLVLGIAAGLVTTGWVKKAPTNLLKFCLKKRRGRGGRQSHCFGLALAADKIEEGKQLPW